MRKVQQADGPLVKDPVPPLDRHQFGGALGGALVIPGLYDGHNQTFFFADYSGLKERRGVTTVNTVVDMWFNTADFVAPSQNTYGDSGRGILYSPGHVNFDTSLSKRFTLAGRGNLEFRWDAFNLFNHPGFGFPNAAIGSATAGRITTTVVDNRSMQFALKVNF